MRKIMALIELDEDAASSYAETNGLSYESPLDYFENEFGWIGQSGFSLDYCLICDDDDGDQWARYLTYLVSWVANQQSYDDGEPKESPLRFEEWQQLDKQ